jgi:hypothetical protein
MYQIEKEGACLDSVHVGDSLIENGGKGIFATRAIKKGQIILPAPLYALKQSATISKDVVVNQCFGHDDSDLLLCPLSLVAFINHGASSSKSCSADECVNGANADYEWSRWNKINLYVDSLSVDDIIQVRMQHLTALVTMYLLLCYDINSLFYFPRSIRLPIIFRNITWLCLLIFLRPATLQLERR